ncbi:hypothetical protein CCACVL1_29307 [Corchorus capsularis]|uniref:Uncharacterized protein n=1 Tax=Corchorus capsularis TaxID=210143 RepID=A0A1R3G2A5_COCAP|nr:hypothetical protein CCACVL1_29307 [Corchorus capsularis]
MALRLIEFDAAISYTSNQRAKTLKDKGAGEFMQRRLHSHRQRLKQTPTNPRSLLYQQKTETRKLETPKTRRNRHPETESTSTPVENAIDL